MIHTVWCFNKFVWICLVNHQLGNLMVILSPSITIIGRKITMFQLNIHHIKGESGWENPCTWSNEFSHDISFISPRFPNLSPPKIPHFPQIPQFIPTKNPHFSPIYHPKIHHFSSGISEIIPAGPGHANDGHHGQPSVGQLLRFHRQNHRRIQWWLSGGLSGGYLAIISWISPKLLGRWMDIWSAWTGGKCDLVGGAISILKNMSLSMGRMTSHIWNGK